MICLQLKKDIHIEQDSNKQNIQSKMNPWKFASISWLIPGLGQVYTHNWLRAFIFFTIYVSLYIVRTYAFCYSIFLAAGVLFFQLNILPLWAGLDIAYYKKPLMNYTEKSQILAKNPWLAVFLSLVLPGLGHAYLKRWFLFAVFSISYLALNLLPVSNLCMITSKILLKISMCIHAYIISCNTKRERTFYKFVLFAVLVLFLINIAIPGLIARYFIEVTSLKEATSMNSAIDEGDLIVINKFAYTFFNPKVGDIVDINISFLKDSRLPPEFYLELQKINCSFFTKRIIAIGGDLVQINNEGIYVNNTLQRKFGIDESIGPSSLKVNSFDKIERLAVFKAFKVPKDCFFVLGDNIEESLDSRDFGAVPRSMIIGKVIKIYH